MAYAAAGRREEAMRLMRPFEEKYPTLLLLMSVTNTVVPAELTAMAKGEIELPMPAQKPR